MRGISGYCLQNKLICMWAVMCQSAPGVHVFRKPLVFTRNKGDVLSSLVVIAVMFSGCL